MHIKLISLTIVEHQDSLRNRGKQLLGNSLLKAHAPDFPRLSISTWRRPCRRSFSLSINYSRLSLCLRLGFCKGKSCSVCCASLCLMWFSWRKVSIEIWLIFTLIKTGYAELMVIPKGSTSVLLKDTTSNYLGNYLDSLIIQCNFRRSVSASRDRSSFDFEVIFQLIFRGSSFSTFSIDRMHKWRPIKYSFVYVLITLTSLVCMDKIRKKCCLRARLVSLISK